MNKGLSKEEELEIKVILRLKTFGDREKVEQRVVVSVARAVHHGTHLPFDIETVDGVFTYDPLGDDSGHHPGHDLPLIRKSV